MFIGLETPLKVGNTVMLTLRFEKAGEVVVHVPIMKAAGMKMNMPQGSHDMKQMDKKLSQ